MKNVFFPSNKYFFIILLIYSSISFSQQTSRTIPDKISNYGSASANSFTGGFNYSVPLFSLSEKDISISTSVNYGSNGVSVYANTPLAGIDWRLNAGGVISRTVKDLPDTAGTAQYNYHSPIEYTRWYKQEENWVFDGQTTDSIARATSDIYYSLDTEPDWFTFNVNGISGEFFFDEDLTIHMSSDESLILNYDEGDSVFELIDDRGFTYYFGEEKDGNKMINKRNIITENHIIGEDVYPGVSMLYTSEWHLTRIVSPSGNIINFNYIIDYYVNFLSLVNSLSLENTCSSHEDLEEGKLIQSITSDLVVGFSHFLSEIVFSDSKIDFTYIDMQDYYLLEEVTLSSNFESIKKYKFNYEHLISPEHSDPLLNPPYHGEIRKRSFLTGIDKVSSSDVVQERYSFKYYNKELLPCRFSYDRDEYGYFNGSDNSTKPFPTPSDSTVYDLLVSTVDATTLDTYFGADHSVNPLTVQYGMLNKITYPTGGYTEIVYEANTDEQDGNIIYGPGVRVQSIVDVNGTDEYKREYFYNTIEQYPSNETSLLLSPKNKGWAKYDYVMHHCYPPSSTYDFTKYIFTDNSLLAQYNRNIGPYYTAITEFKIQDGEIGSTIESKYAEVVNNPPTSINGGEVITGAPNSNNSKALYGLLNERSYYKKNATGFDLVKRDTYQYNTLDEQSFYANVFLRLGLYWPEINISRYKNWNFVTKLVSKTTQLYDTNANLINETSISYSYYDAPYYKLQGTESINSLGENLLTTYRYPQDIANPSLAEQELVNQHRVSTPLETKTYLDNDLLFTKYVRYKDWGINATDTGNLILPEKVDVAKGDTSLESETIIPI